MNPSPVAIVTDSAAQLPPELVVGLGVSVVPITVTVGDRSYREGVDLDADGFCTLVDSGVGPVSTTQPSPGELLAAYESAARSGALAICSIHVGSDVSGSVNAARLAAAMLMERYPRVVVRVVDSGTASFGTGLAVWAAADVVASGGTLDETAAVAERCGSRVLTAFSLGGIDLARRSGRFSADVLDAASVALGAVEIPVLGGTIADLQVVGSARDADELVDIVVARLEAATDPLRVGVCLAHPSTRRLVVEIRRRVEAIEMVAELVEYRVGPSVAAHTGVDTVGWVAAPVATGSSPLVPLAGP